MFFDQKIHKQQNRKITYLPNLILKLGFKIRQNHTFKTTFKTIHIKLFIRGFIAKNDIQIVVLKESNLIPKKQIFVI